MPQHHHKQQQQQQQSHHASSISRATTPATFVSTGSTSPSSTTSPIPTSAIPPATNTQPLKPEQLPTSPVSISSSSSSSPISTSVASSITNSPTPFNPLPTRSINFAALDSKIQQQANANSSLHASIHPLPHVNTQLPSRSQFPSSVPTQTSTPNTISPVQFTLPSRSQSPVVPPLHDLVNDCFLLTIDKLHDESRIFIANSFHQCVAKQHCEENLEFLIDIYRYEYEYNLKVLTSTLTNCNDNTTATSTNPPSLSTSFRSKVVASGFNHDEATSMAKMKLNAPSPSITPTTHGASSASLLRRHRNTSSVTSFDSLKKKQSIRSDDLDPQQAFVSTIDDLDLNAPWDSFGQSHVGDDEEYSDDDDDEEHDVNGEGFLSQQDLHELNERWFAIMENYIKHDSPSQINISQKLFKEIVEESSICKLHNPLILLKARNEVLQILKENCYCTFASKFKKQLAQPCDQASCCPCGMEIKSVDKLGSPSNNHSSLTLEATKSVDSASVSCNECREISSTSTATTVNESPSSASATEKPQKHHHHHHHHHYLRNQDSPNLSSSSSIAASLLGKLSLPKRGKSAKQQPPQKNGNIPPSLYGETSSPSSNSSSMSNIFGHIKLANNGDASPSSAASSTRTSGIPISSSSRKQQPLSSSLQQQGASTVTTSATGSATVTPSTAAHSLPIPRSLNASPISLNSVASNAQKDREREGPGNSSASLLNGGSLSSSLKFWKRKS